MDQISWGPNFYRTKLFGTQMRLGTTSALAGGLGYIGLKWGFKQMLLDT